MSVVRLLLWGLAAIALAAAIGFGIELSRFGRSDRAAAEQAERTVRDSVMSTSAATDQAARSAASRAQLPGPDNTNQDVIRRLFDVAVTCWSATPPRSRSTTAPAALWPGPAAHRTCRPTAFAAALRCSWCPRRWGSGSSPSGRLRRPRRTGHRDRLWPSTRWRRLHSTRRFRRSRNTPSRRRSVRCH